MSNSIIIANHEMTIKEYNGQRVITFRDIDTVHKRPDGTAKRNFNENKGRFVEGTDYFNLDISQRNEIRTLEIPNRGITVITLSGYLMLAKSLNDDLAWEIQRELVNTYFKAKTQTVTSSDKYKIQRMNANVRTANMYYKLAQVETLSETYKSILISKAAEALSGQQLIPLPKTERKTYTAEEIGSIFGVSANKVGRVANANELKTKDFGEFYRDKSPYSSKEVDSFRYFDNVIPRFSELLGVSSDDTL